VGGRTSTSRHHHHQGIESSSNRGVAWRNGVKGGVWGFGGKVGGEVER
jgi:hypothetical protein